MTARNELTRRDAITTLAAGSAALFAGCTRAGASRPAYSGEEPMTTSPAALPGNHTPLPLPFAAASLNGLSDRLITSHHENNYGGAVKNLNRVEQELAKTNAETPPFVVAALRERELTFRNSKSLHEAYFGNLGGDGKRAGAIESALTASYGSSATWEQHFRATAAGLGGGSGWVILALELDTGRLRTIASGSHTQTLSLGVPLLVLDMYEHSYHIDFGAAVARYVDAFFVNINWEIVSTRLASAQRARAALSGGAS
jgi:superoxide dismutase, Fe-Mn family